jgi:hypothetical protein
MARSRQQQQKQNETKDLNVGTEWEPTCIVTFFFQTIPETNNKRIFQKWTPNYISKNNPISNEMNGVETTKKEVIFSRRPGFCARALAVFCHHESLRRVFIYTFCESM